MADGKQLITDVRDYSKTKYDAYDEATETRFRNNVTKFGDKFIAPYMLELGFTNAEMWALGRPLQVASISFLENLKLVINSEATDQKTITEVIQNISSSFDSSFGADAQIVKLFDNIIA